jgi:hypothetical protein
VLFTCSGVCVFLPRSFLYFLFFFARSPLWIVALLLGGRSLIQLCYPVQLLFPLYVVFVVLWLTLSYFAFVLGFVALFHLLPYRVMCSSVAPTLRIKERAVVLSVLSSCHY